MNKLLKRLLRSFVKMDAINLNDATETPYDTAANQLGNNEIDVGVDAQVLADSLCDEGMEPEVNKFFDHVRLFLHFCEDTKEIPFHFYFLVKLDSSEPYRASHIQRLPKCSCPSCQNGATIAT